MVGGGWGVREWRGRCPCFWFVLVCIVPCCMRASGRVRPQQVSTSRECSTDPRECTHMPLCRRCFASERCGRRDKHASTGACQCRCRCLQPRVFFWSYSSWHARRRQRRVCSPSGAALAWHGAGRGAFQHAAVCSGLLRHLQHRRNCRWREPPAVRRASYVRFAGCTTTIVGNTGRDLHEDGQYDYGHDHGLHVGEADLRHSKCEGYSGR